jgi:hypothetical protein
MDRSGRTGSVGHRADADEVTGAIPLTAVVLSAAKDLLSAVIPREVEESAPPSLQASHHIIRINCLG